MACRGTGQGTTPTGGVTPTEAILPEPTFTPTLFSSDACIWDWGTRPLPELSAQVQAALASAGVADATAKAVAYGEDCIDPQTGDVKGFALLETDFYFTLAVSSLAVEPLGNLAEQVLTVLDSLPPGSIPGTQPGYIGMDFVVGEERYHLWFEITLWWEAREAGLHGAALLEALSRPFAQTPVPTATPVSTLTPTPTVTWTPVGGETGRYEAKRSLQTQSMER
ncbi:MAG: hypothetical protein H5T63_07675 [Chloroflexi bacterium]|nr:hypothetical protein [Chloroflexota bacterium]